MSFVPNDRRNLGMPPAVRSVIFWVLMIMLAVVLWQMVARPGNGTSAAPPLTYTEFMKQVDDKNVKTAKFTLSANTAAVAGALTQPPLVYSATVPRETAASLMDALRSQGVSVTVSEGGSRANFIVGIAPIVLLVSIWIFMIWRQMRSKQDPPLPGPPSQGALG